jgi:hypothetical protein
MAAGLIIVRFFAFLFSKKRRKRKFYKKNIPFSFLVSKKVTNKNATNTNYDGAFLAHFNTFLTG